MANKDGVDPHKSRNATLWRFSLWGLAALCLVMAGVLWMSGTYETRDAAVSGRRLIIRLDTGAIEGRQISMENIKTAAAPKPAPEPVAESAAPPPESAPESPPPVQESAAPPLESPPAPADPQAEPPAAAVPETAAPAPILTDTGSIRPALVPLAELNEALMERTALGALPIIGPKALKPWRYYAKPYRHKGHLPTIAILVTGLGQNRLVTDGAIKLPENMSLSFSPYAKDLSSWVNAARIAGHEVMIDLPLEPSNYPASDPGPYGLLAGKGPQENAMRMQWLMSCVQGYTGFTTPQNESFSANGTAFKALLELLSSRGLMVVMEHEPAKNETKKILDTSNASYVIADIRIDEELTANAIQTRLSTLEKMASKHGYAIGIAQPFPLTIQQLELWSAELEKNGFTLVPVTFIAGLKFPS